MTDRRAFLRWLGGLPVLGRYLSPLASPRAVRGGSAPPTVVATPTALYQQPEGRRNLVRITVTGLDAPAGRARVTDRRGALVGSAGLLPAGPVFLGEVWVPLSEPSQFQIDVEVGKTRVARSRVRLVPPKRWTLYWLSTIHTDVGYTDLQERCLEIHRENLDAALARLPGHPDYRWTAECALQVISYVENRSPEAAGALVEAIRGGKIGFQSLFANLLTGLLDHETLARVVWPAGLLAPGRGLPDRLATRPRFPPPRTPFGPRRPAGGARRRHRPHRRAVGPKKGGVKPPVRLPADRAGPRRRLLPRLGAPLGGEAAGAPRRHGLLLGRRGRFHGGRARPVPPGAARGAGGGAGRSVGRPAGAAGRRGYGPARPTRLGTAGDVARPPLVWRAHLGRGRECLRPGLAPDGGAMAVQAALAGRRRGGRRAAARRGAAQDRRGHPGGRGAPRVQRVELAPQRGRPRPRRRRPAARVRGRGAPGGGLPRRVRPRPDARCPRAGLPRAGRKRAASSPGDGRRRGARRAGGSLSPGARLGNRRRSVSRRRRQGAGEPGRLVRAEPARVRARRRALGALDRQVARLPQGPARAGRGAGAARRRAPRAASRDRRASRGDPAPPGLPVAHLDRDPVRRAPLDRRRESACEDPHARERSPVCRLPLRADQAPRRGRSAPGAAGRGPLPAKAAALSLPDPGVLVVGAKPADDGEGVVVKLLDVAGAARSVTIRPAAYTFRAARRANLVEMNGDTLAVTQDGYVALDLPAWGVGAARLFTPREGSG